MLACTHAHIDAHTQHFGQDTEQFSSASRKAYDYLNIKVLLYRGKITKDYCTARCCLNCFPVQLMQANFKIKISSKLSLTLGKLWWKWGREHSQISAVSVMGHEDFRVKRSEGRQPVSRTERIYIPASSDYFPIGCPWSPS